MHYMVYYSLLPWLHGNIYIPICVFLTYNCFLLLYWASFIHFQPLFFIVMLYSSYLFAKLVMLSIGSLTSVSACSLVKGVQSLSEPFYMYLLSCCLAFVSLPIAPYWISPCTPQSCHLSSHLDKQYCTRGILFLVNPGSCHP